jgi:hypothetical protein
MASTFICGPAIASLRASSRMAENKLIRAGRYGPVLWHEGVAYVALAGVERHLGQHFAAEQIATAIAGKPNRILIIPEQEAA